MVKERLGQQKSPQNRADILNSVGDAAQVTLLLSDWKNFGLSERVCYHLDLFENLTSTTHTAPEQHQSVPESVCGVYSLLECVPSVSWKDLTKHQRKAFRNHCKEFNLQAELVRNYRSKPYHQPPQLPIRLSPATRVSFAYEMTRMALVLDASPTLVSAFGASDSDEHVCAMDRISGMVKTFFETLTEPIPTSYTTGDRIQNWTPVLAVTVLAVYPHGGKKDENNTSILVRDYRVQNKKDAQRLADNIHEWVLSHVETTIAKRLNSAGVGLVGYNSWAIPKYTSSLRDLLDAGYVALDFLPSKARPCIVLATDCRAVSCDEILDLFTYEERMDMPIHVLDLSSPTWHRPRRDSTIMRKEDNSNSLVYDPGGPSAFPLHMSDDSETLFAIARATAGSFFDAELLELASTTKVGQVQIGSPLGMDQYLAIKRRALRPNALQWYLLFSLSPLTQSTTPAFPHTLLHPAGNLVPPEHLRRRMGIQFFQKSASNDDLLVTRNSSTTSFATTTPVQDNTGGRTVELRPPPYRMTFSTYVVNPVHIKGLLMARIKEGYRAKQYGTSTHDSDKISIQLTLLIEYGTVLHYELQYKALNAQNPLVGVAHVKVEVSGDRTFVQNMKNEFRLYTVSSRDASRLVKVLWWLRSEDLVQSVLCPVAWGDKLSAASSPFVRRLGSLSRLQMMRNYRIDRFDVVCTGRMPYTHDEDLPWSDFLNVDNGEQEIFEALSTWSTQVIQDKSKYVKHVPASDSLTAYCVVQVSQSPMASRLFTITVNTIEGCGIQYRLKFVAELKDALRGLRDVSVLPKRMYESLVGVPVSSSKASHLAWRSHFLENHFEHEEWKPVKDPELLDLLMRRRSEIGIFFLLHSTDTYALFAKDISVQTGKMTENPLDDVHLVEYQIELKGDAKQPVVNMHVEKEVGLFATDADTGIAGHLSRAHRLFVRVKRRDQECSVALRSRTNLLSLFSDKRLSRPPDQELKNDVERLLAYSYSHSRELRFFQGFRAANTELERLTVDVILSGQLADDIVKLDINPSLNVGNQDDGHWFFMKFDRYTLSLVHLPLVEKTKAGDNTYDYRELTFFTFGISDLYCVRDESVIDDDESSQGHISEYMAVEEFADDLETAHKENYAEAAYLALRSPEDQPAAFSKEDFDLVLAVCEFTKVVEVFVSQESLSVCGQVEQSKLMTTIEDLLTVVPGNDGLMFYSEEPGDRTPLVYKGDTEIADFEGDALYDDDLSWDESEVIDTPDEESTKTKGSEIGASSLSQAVPPVFIRFSFDGEDIQPHELVSIAKGANLTVHMSIFKTRDEAGQRYGALPQLHTSVAIEIENALASYVAEQTLERMRTVGKSIEEVDLGAVRKCLRKARGVRISFFDVHFYVAKSDKMVAASHQARNQHSSESEIEEGFKLFVQELQSSQAYQLRLTSNDSFCVIEAVEEGDGLKYWGFITIKKSLGLVTVEVYHPEGLTKASSILSSLHDFVARICHRTNQLLLLQTLHRTRIASSYLIQASGQNVEDGLFKDGHFSCPVVFGECYELYHRCSAPKVIASLISIALHSFAVSNRERIFVYKDEAMGIFYLSLEEVASENQGTENVKLLVFGVQEPGASVTVQLTRLLRKKILLLAVDAWASVLKKNPHFSWKKADLEFLQNFQSQWSKEDDDTTTTAVGKNEYWFELPESVYDPLSVLMYFRQNICGSTFFHRLNEAIIDDTDQPEEPPLSIDSCQDGAEIVFDPNEFVFFYNNTPSPLDPNFQALSTLTARGKRYSERTGTGVAIIELSLVRKGDDAESSSKFRIGSPPGSSACRLSTPLDLLRAKEVVLSDPAEDVGRKQPATKFLVSIRLTDTDLNREALKDWLLLTLNQVVVAWLIERQIQRSSTGLLSPYLEDDQSLEHENIRDTVQERRLKAINELSPGLPSLMSIFQSATDLPHPAVQVVEFNTVMMSSSVASHTVGLLRDCIINMISSGKSTHTTSLMGRTLVIRSSRGDRPQIAKLVAKPERRGKIASFEFGESAKKAIGDSPIDCPEYLCYFSWEFYSDLDEEEMSVEVPMVFPEVMIGDVVSERRASLFSQRLVELKKLLPSAFQRSFAFVLSVKRNHRTLTMYNWDPKLAKRVISKVNELEAASVSDTGVKLCSNQRRCLGDLAPFVRRTAGGNRRIVSAAKDDPSEGLPDVVSPGPAIEPKPSSGPKRRIQRPTSIRRPKLVGKSVEGAAMQAMAASREKARAITKGPSRATTTRTASESAVKPVISAATRVEQPDEDGAESALFRRKFCEAVGATWASPFAMSRTNFEVLQEYWFRSAETLIRKSTRDIVLLQTKPLWNDASELFSLTRKLSKDQPTEFTRQLEAVMQSVGACKIVPTTPKDAGDAGKVVFFMTAVKNSSTTTFLVFRISARRSRGKERKETMNCDAWMMKLLHADGAKVAKKRRSRKSIEKRSAALGAKCGIADQLITRLEARLFDYSAALAEQAALQTEKDVLNDDYLHLTEKLVQRYTFDAQQEMPRLKYRAFDATIILKSYEDKFIDKFDSFSLFKHFYSLDSTRGINCGPDTILFPQRIKMYETTTHCFLKRNRTDETKMGLVYLCKTEGRDLDEYAFPEGSNVAATIFKLIVVEGARLAYNVLRESAIEMYRDSVWEKASALNSQQPPKFDELLSMVSSRSVLVGSDISTFLRDEKLAIDPEDLFVKMSRDSLFSPSRKIRIQDDGYHIVFFNRKLDAFIMFNLYMGQVIDILLLRRDKITDEDSKNFVEMFTQYMLFYLWKS